MKRSTLSCLTMMCFTCIGTASLATEGEWVRLSDNAAQRVNADGSVSTRFFGSEAQSAAQKILAKAVADLTVKVEQGNATADDLITLARTKEALENAQCTVLRGSALVGNHVGTDRVVKFGDTCEVNYSIDHQDGPSGVGGVSLRVIAQSSASWDLWGPYKPITSITHYNSGTIIPTGPAAGLPPVTTYSTITFPTSFRTSGSSITDWYYPVFADQTDYCTASAATIITVQYDRGSSCLIAQTTAYPDCTAHR